MSAERDPLALAPVTVRRCDIERLKRKIAKLRRQRDEWRKRAKTAERAIASGTYAYHENARRLEREAALRERSRLQDEVLELQRIITSKVLDKLKVKP